MKKLLVLLFLLIPLLFACDNGLLPGGDNGGNSNDAGNWVEEMENGDYDAALQAVENVIAGGSKEPETLLYASLLNMAALSTSENTQTFMRNAGFSNYPSKMGDLFDFPMVNVGDETEPLLLPELRDDEGNVVTNFNDYLPTIVENLVTAYPNGFNAPVEGMISTYNIALVKVLSYLGNIPDDASIELTKEMILPEAAGMEDVWPTDGEGNDLKFVIGKAEILLAMSSLELISGIINYVGSVDYTFPLGEFYNVYQVTHSPQPPEDFGVDDLPINPLRTLLQASPDASVYLDKSKQDIVNALGHLTEAVDLVLARTGDDFVISPGFIYLEESSWPEEDTAALNFIKTFVGRIKSSISTGSTFFFPFDFFGNAVGYIEGTAAWPTKADWGVVGSEEPSALAFNLSALFDKPIIAIDTYFEIETTGEPTVFNISDINNPDPVTEFSLADFNDDTKPASDYAFKLKDCTLSGLFVDMPEDYIASIVTKNKIPGIPNNFITPTQSGNSIYLSIGTKDFYYSMFNEPTDPATEFDSDFFVDADNNPVVLETTGSFWYHIVQSLPYFD